MKTHHLTAPDGSIYKSLEPGTMGGNSRHRIHGRLDCWSANRALPTYASIRFFFADEQAAIAAGYRPCGHCMREGYKVWKAGGRPRSEGYPWQAMPK